MARKKKDCEWEVKKGETCGDIATSSVLLRDRVGSARVPVCDLHKAEYNRKAASLRVAK